MDINGLALPKIDITSDAFATDPFTLYREAINQHWLAETEAGYMILGFEDMRDILIKDDILQTPNHAITQLMGAEGTIWGDWNSRFLLAKTGEEHRRLRMLVAKTFTPRNAELHRPVMVEVISELLDHWCPKGEFDFTEFASYFPITVMCRLIGADPGLVPEMKNSLKTQGFGFSLDPSILPELNNAIEFMWNVVDRLFTERETNPHAKEEDKDLLDQLLDATKVKDGLTRQELYDLLILVFGGGYDTSKNGLGLIVHLLLDRPDYWERLANEEGFAKKVLDETLRLINVVTTYRIAREDFFWKDVTIPAGTMLIFPLPLAGHDESVYENAATFDPDRVRSGDTRPFAFGRGEHNCLG